VPTRRPRHLAAQRAPFGAGRPLHRIDRDPFHSGQIDDQAVRTPPSEVTVPARARRHFQFITPRKLHRPQRVIFVRALHDGSRHPLRCCVPIKNPPGAFVLWLAGANQTSLESRAQAVDSVAIDFISIVAPKELAARRKPECSRGGDGSFDEVASRGPVHLARVQPV